MDANTQNRQFPNEPYRGVKPFRYVDELIFSARDWEKEQLLNLILLYRGCLLYGASGVGKSSLINAGLLPILQQNNLQPHIIRIYPNKEGIFRVYKIKTSENAQEFLPSAFDNFAALQDEEASIGLSLDQFRKIILSHTYPDLHTGSIETAERVMPVLIFDQFEELITLFEESNKITVIQQDLALGKSRKQSQLELIDFFRDCYYNNNLRIKFLFSFREDYLAKFSMLFRAIPDLRNHSLRVLAIDDDEIKQIISCPFTHKFDWDKAPFDEELIDLLTENFEKHFEDDDVVLTDIQIVCQYVYETAPEERKALLNDKELLEDCIDNIIMLFNAQLLEKLSAEDKPLAIGILSLLVLNERTRNIYHADAIVSELKDRFSIENINRVLRELDSDTKLIKSEVRDGSNRPYYEINSESLIPYINSLKIKRQEELEQEKLADELKKQFIKEQEEKEEKEEQIKRKEEEKKEREKQRIKQIRDRRITIFLSIAVIVLGAIVYIYFNRSKNNKSESYLIAAKYGNDPSFGYALITKRLEKDKNNDSLKAYIEGLRNQYIISDMIYIPDDEQLISIFSRKDTVIAISQNSITYFDRKSGGFYKKDIVQGIVLAGPNNNYLLVNTEKSNGKYELKDLKNLKKIFEFSSYKYPRFITVSSNGNYVLVNNQICCKNCKLNNTLKNKNEGFKTAAVFTEDNKNLIVGTQEGDIELYDVRGKLIQNTFNVGFAISSLNISKNSKYLIVGGERNNLQLIKLDSLRVLNYLLKDTKKIHSLLQSGSSPIKQIVLLPYNEGFATVGDKAIVWDFNGKIIETISLDYEVQKAFYAVESKSFVTYNPAERNVYILKKFIPNLEPATFSPLDYRLTSLSDFTDNAFTAGKIYPDNSPFGNFKAILNYSASLKKYSNFSFIDKSQKRSLNRSVSELSDLYKKAFAQGNFVKLSILNKKMLYSSYGSFKSDSLQLQNREADINVYNRIIYEKLKLKEAAMLLDEINVGSALELFNQYKKLAGAFASDLTDKKDYKQAVTCLRAGTAMGEKIKQKFQGIDLATSMGTMYGNLSYYSIYTKQFDVAIASAKNGVSFGNKFDWIYTNLALGYLLSDKYDDAKTIYLNYKDKNITDPQFGSFRKSFKEDLDNFIKEGIIDTTNVKLNRQIKDIRNILK